MRLRFVAAVNPQTPEFDLLEDDAEVAFVPLEDVWPPPRWSPERLRPRSEIKVGYTRFRNGDILVPKITPTFEASRSVVALDLPTSVAAGTTEVHVVRPVGCDPRYLNYCFQSKRFLGEGEASMVGVAGQKRVPERFLLDYAAFVHDVELQRRIVAVLDIETARIDGVIGKRIEVIRLVQEKWRSELAAAFSARRGVRLKHVLAAPLVYGVLVPEHDPEGVPMLRIVDLRSGTVDLDSVARIPPRLSDEYRRSIVRAGELVVSVVGTLGRSIEISAELAGSNLNRALARVQLQDDVPRSLIRLFFASDLFATQATLATSGDSAQPTLGLNDMKNFDLALPHDRSGWTAISHALEERETHFRQILRVLARQVELLREKRQALITAAVTGESVTQVTA
jgi:type I restriction enzyme S subunit